MMHGLHNGRKLTIVVFRAVCDGATLGLLYIHTASVNSSYGVIPLSCLISFPAGPQEEALDCV